MAHVNPSRSSARSEAKTPDAIALLKQDHRSVEELFDEFEDAEDGEGIEIAQRICQMLTVHAQIEEEILYPAAKNALSEDEEQSDLVWEAEVEHASAKELIAKIEEMQEQDEAYNATVKVLSEYIKHHVKEEEGQLFPALKKSELDLKELGAQLFERKQELMTELGVESEGSEEEEEDEEESSGRRGSKAKGSGSPRH
jgi:hemerythrin superfamily protein